MRKALRKRRCRSLPLGPLWARTDRLVFVAVAGISREAVRWKPKPHLGLTAATRQNENRRIGSRSHLPVATTRHGHSPSSTLSPAHSTDGSGPAPNPLPRRRLARHGHRTRQRRRPRRAHGHLPRLGADGLPDRSGAACRRDRRPRRDRRRAAAVRALGRRHRTSAAVRGFSPSRASSSTDRATFTTSKRPATHTPSMESTWASPPPTDCDVGMIAPHVPADLHGRRLTLVPLADEHLEWEVELSPILAVIRYISGRRAYAQQPSLSHGRQHRLARRDGAGRPRRRADIPQLRDRARRGPRRRAKSSTS